jgi:arsenite methyltransferase
MADEAEASGPADSDAPAGGDGLDAETQRMAVRECYAAAATDDGGCCDSPTRDNPDARARELGYDDEDVDAVADGANLGLGCGTPTAIAGLDQGDSVLDLGSGGGFDCFLAARQVGDAGRVVGVDMTPEMVETARENAAENDVPATEFRLGEIEHLPVADATVDVVMSNCVVNLSPDKPQVFREAYRVLRPGGEVAISDLVATRELPAAVREAPEAVAGCVGGASRVPDLEAMLADAGFVDVSVDPDADSEAFDGAVVPATIQARKPSP